MAKLTLHVPDELVAAAKTEAAARETSVSKLVSDFFRNLASKNPGSMPPDPLDLSPRTRCLAGCIPNAEINSYLDYLDKKHS